LRQRAENGKKYADAGLMLAQRRWADAERIVNEAPPHPAAASIFSVLGMIHGGSEEWAAATTNYAKVVSLVPDDDAAYHFLTALRVQAGDVEKYRLLCDEILRRFAGTTNATIAERCAKDCLILPPPASDLGSIAKLAETAVLAGPSHEHWPSLQFVKGFAEYRQGRFASAAAWLQKVVNQKSDKYRTVQAHMILAMTQHQLKQSVEARLTLAKGLEIAEARFAKHGSGNFEEQWHDWIFAHALMREASALLNSDSTKTGANPKPL
jgi:tetratricopeptide (TPR) repeat protein